MKSFLLAVQFLTIIPIRISSTVTGEMMGRSVGAFPLAGAVQGLVLGGAAALCSLVLPPGVAAAIVVSLALLVNGGFHMDGLADTCDALAVKTSGDKDRDRERRLGIMKDSTVGPVGAAAIVVILLLKYASIAALLPSVFGPKSRELGLIFLYPVLGRWGMVPAIVGGRPARADGLGRLFMEHAGRKELVSASLWAMTLAGGVWAMAGFPALPFAVLIGGTMFGLFALSVAMQILGERIVGGLTGDLLGGLAELGETLALLAFLAWKRAALP